MDLWLLTTLPPPFPPFLFISHGMEKQSATSVKRTNVYTEHGVSAVRCGGVRQFECVCIYSSWTPDILLVVDSVLM